MISPVSTASTGSASADAQVQNARAKQQQAAKQAAAADQKAQDAKAALTTLTAQTKAKTDPQKAAQAKAKLQALQKRLQSLMLMGGDPKTLAKQAAQLLKEIGQAAKDYADATGDGSAGAGAALAAAPASTAQSADGQSADGQSSEEQSGDAQAPMSAEAQIDAQAKATVQNVATSFSGPAAAAQMKKPDDVIQGAQGMVASAKALIQSAEARAKHEHKDGPEFQDARDAGDQADKAIAQANKTLGVEDPFSGYTASGAAAPIADTGPAVSVQA